LFILDNFISEQLIFTDSDFQEVVISAFLLKYDQSEDELRLPVLGGLYQVAVFTSRRIHYKRRPVVTGEQ
jgi:hypothetical protein